MNLFLLLADHFSTNLFVIQYLKNGTQPVLRSPARPAPVSYTHLQRILEARGQYRAETIHLGEISRESGYELARKAYQEGTLAEAMLLGSDEVAEGALEAFRELGIRVPKDVAVVIYQDLQTLESKWPTGTCLEMFPDYVWENALEDVYKRKDDRRRELSDHGPAG